jgi:hypothetical protein
MRSFLIRRRIIRSSLHIPKSIAGIVRCPGAIGRKENARSWWTLSTMMAIVFIGRRGGQMRGIDNPGPFYADPPFGVPPDIVLELPLPLSVNRTRKIDWSHHARARAWRDDAGLRFLMQKRFLPSPIKGRYELILTLRDGSRMDADNGVKIIVDALRRWGLVEDDDPKHLRKLTVEFGAVEGCRVTIRPMA